jgi:hypothetical protein
MSSVDILRELLSEAVDDYLGFWEISQILEREYGRRVGRQEAKKHLRSLIDLGLVDGFRGTRFGGEERPIPREILLEELDIDHNWRPSGGAYVRIAASDLGEEEYYAGGSVRN